MSSARALFMSVLLAASFPAVDVAAQARIESMAREVASIRLRLDLPSPHAAAMIGSPVRDSASTGQVIVGSVTGWVVGIAGGAALGYAIQPDGGDSWIGAAEWWLGAWLGSSIGAAGGAWLANESTGRVVLAGVAALVVVPAVLFIARGPSLAMPVGQIAASVVIIRL